MKLRHRFWRFLHGIVNSLAWLLARPPGPEWGSSLRINHKHPLWRLNDWLANKWVIELTEQAMERSRALQAEWAAEEATE